MKRLSLDLAGIGCYLVIPVIIFLGIELLADHVFLGCLIIFMGSILCIALATVFQYVGKLMDDGKLDERSNTTLSNLSGTPWEKEQSPRD